MNKGKDIYKIFTTKSKFLKMQADQEVLFPLSTQLDDQIKKMINTLKYHEGPYYKRGLALSSTQVGLNKRFFVMVHPRDICRGLRNKYEVICNPEILEIDQSEKTEEFEGCLSILKEVHLVERPTTIIVKYQTPAGKIVKDEFEGLLARVFLHEMDHLNGVTVLQKTKGVRKNDLYTDWVKRRISRKETIGNDSELEDY